MNPRTRSRMPASIGSNQASPANSVGPSACVLVLSCSMAWSPPALERRKWLVEQARDYATNPFPPHPRRHRHPVLRIYITPLTTERTSTVRLLPPRLAGGMDGPISAHSSSVRSLG